MASSGVGLGQRHTGHVKRPWPSQPVTVVVSTTLQEISTGAGAGGDRRWTLLPMRDLIRMAGHAYHYLAVFDEHRSRPLYLARPRRIASADQRVILYAKDRGCTAPGCDVPGYWTDVHHTDRLVPGRPDRHRRADVGLQSPTTDWLIRLADNQPRQRRDPVDPAATILTTASRRPTTITIQKGFSTATHGAGELLRLPFVIGRSPSAGPNTRELSSLL